MGVDTKIYFPSQTRLCDVADVMATLLGHPTAFVKHDGYSSCDVEGVNTRGIEEMPECAYIVLRDRRDSKYFSPLYQFEAGGGHNPGDRIILLGSTALVIALARRLIDFFGGAVCYMDCDGGINYEKAARWASAPEDGEDWTRFEREKADVKPLTVDEIAACENWAAYKAHECSSLCERAPWLWGA